MKTISLSFVLSAVILPATLQAQPPVEKEADTLEEKRPKPNFDEMWKRVDADGNGFVSEEEFAKLPRLAKLPEEKRKEIFKRLDKDADGKLSRPEMEQMARGPMARLKELDIDNSGGISFEEFKAGEMFKKMPPEKQASIFKRLDSDGDGQITPRDKPPHPRKNDDRPDGPPPTPEEIIKRGDKDGDSALSFEEFRKDPHIRRMTEDEQEDRFEEMDKNKDQKLTKDEFPPQPPHPIKPPEGKPDAEPAPGKPAPPPAPEEPKKP